MKSNVIIGHEHRRSSLKRLVQTGKLPSTMMFAGPTGIGKRLVALELSYTLLCEQNISLSKNQALSPASYLIYGGCCKCKSCRLLEAGNHADFHLVQCLDKETWNMARLRELLSTLSLNAFCGGSRIVLFNDAEYLSLPAANLLLKALEEPRPDTYYLLVTGSPSRLPATLLSRCQIWFFDALTREQVKQILAQRTQAGELNFAAGVPLEEISLLAEGTLEGIESVAQHYESWRYINDKLSQIFYGDLAAAVNLAAEFGKDRESLRTNLQLMRIAARERMHQSEEPITQTKWAVFLTNLISAERLIFERNLGPTNVLNVALINLVAKDNAKTFTGFTSSASLLEKITV